MLEFLWNAPIDGSVSLDNARYDESNTSINSSTSRRKLIAIPLQCDRSNRSLDFFFPLHIFFFFLITAGLIATRLVNRVSFVRSACSFFLSFFLFRSPLFRVYSFTAIQQRLVSHQFSNCFQSIDLVDPFIAKRCVARSFKTERFIKCLSLFLFLSFAARGLRRCGRFRRHDGRLWCLRWSG